MTQFKNYLDLIYIWSSVANVVMQNISDPFQLPCKLLMIVIILLALMKTFSYLRIFGNLSPIVTMLSNVIYDLRIFLTFYTILIVLFSLLLGILGIGNRYIAGKFKDAYGVGKASVDSGGYPGSEYDNIGLFLGNIFVTMRMSMGDFGFDAAYMLADSENIIYWFVWFIIVVITAIIFLNFIIAEASASYEKVASELEAFIMREKASLIHESEQMSPSCCGFKNNEKFPKYLIVR